MKTLVLAFVIPLILYGCSGTTTSLRKNHEYKITFVTGPNTPLVGVSATCSINRYTNEIYPEMDTKTYNSNEKGEIIINQERICDTTSFKYFGPFKWNQVTDTKKYICAFTYKNIVIQNAELSKFYNPVIIKVFIDP
jgi:hypothetical protein